MSLQRTPNFPNRSEINVSPARHWSPPPIPSFAQHAEPTQGDKQHHPSATHPDADKGLQKTN
jgi:hypothetical protein